MRRVVDAPSLPSSPSFLFAVLAPFSAPAHPGGPRQAVGRAGLRWAGLQLTCQDVLWHSKNTSPKTAEGWMWLISSIHGLLSHTPPDRTRPHQHLELRSPIFSV